MKLIRRSVLLFLVTLGTASCGFTPVYAPTSKAPAEISDISVAPPKRNRANFFLVAELEERIGRNLTGSKTLKHNLSLSSESSSLFGGAQRARLIGTVTYSVVSNDDGRSLYRGSVTNFVTFSTDGRTTTSPIDDAVERLVYILADQIITKLIAQVY